MSLGETHSNQQYHDDILPILSKRVNDCFDAADVFFAHSFIRSKYNLKQRGKAAGTAHLQKNEIRFNRFMYQQNPREFLETVVPHEVAHIIVYQIYGTSVRPHGKEWQAVMKKVYGITPSRTHSFEVPMPKNSYDYQCACQIHTFSKQRHNRALNGVEYVCKKCRAPLQFTGKMSKSALESL